MDKYWEERTRIEGDCWIWALGTVGARPNNLYGRCTHKGKTWRAHRLSYYWHTGELPGDKLVLHSCDNPLCVNPAHLRLGYWRDNMRDSLNRKRAGNQHIQGYGAKYGQS